MPLPALTDLTDLVTLRHTLHQHPELSGSENETAERVVSFLQRYNPDKIYTNLGETGVAAVFNGISPDGPTIVFRAELDALPIAEANQDLPYRSVYEGKGHKCGHDGHMAILTALGSIVHQQKPVRGKIVLLYQPAEETGAGAMAVLNDKRFTEEIKPDYVFGLHNLPGYTLHQVVVREEVFAAASTGMIIELQGKSSHAAEPENGLNPGQAMAEILLGFNRIAEEKEQFSSFALITVIHARLGEVAFGTNPGFATIMATLRAYMPEDMQKLKALTQQCVEQVSANYSLAFTIRFTEEFTATINSKAEVETIRKVASRLDLEQQEALQPFRWSEDFGHFTARYKGAFFGLGAGSGHAQLHHTDYDFPDDLIPTGAALFYGIIQEILGQ
ncbi:amidohydrolase [Pontibacter burrus]|uniref:Amidohydrolase n=1 Tax=Pontibacter burrus TaxID=2704466 RepID=A0A6B3LWP5_9BACT|nr:amidohydrolase [Pontibacter burrus]NEM98736.1 amidohydrolase [Pontibacter burrus]